MSPETGPDRSYYDGAAEYDTEAVRFFDVAHEGAQLRAVAQAGDLLAGLRGAAPRSVVVLATDAVSEAAAECAVALSDYGRAPVMVTRTLPEFVGALDVVVVGGEAPDAETVTRQVAVAANRGADVVLAGPSGGPVVEDAPRGAVALPAPPTADGASPLRTLAAVLFVCAELSGTPVEGGDLADAVDEELRQLSPERDTTVNLARQLREYSDGARVLHTGYSPAGAAVARLIAALWSARGIPSGFVGREDLAAALEQSGDTAGSSGASGTDDLFYDPFIDGPTAHVPVKTIVWAQRDPHMLGARAEYVDDSYGGGDVAGEAGDAGGIDLSGALRLIVRGLAATAMQVPH